jgi:hypothetical protein
MPKFIKEFAWRASLVLLGILLSPIATRFIGEAYPDFIEKQPRGILAAILIGAGVPLIVLLLIHRARATRKLNIDRQVPQFPFSAMEMEGFAFLVYKGVFWTVEFPTYRSLKYFSFSQQGPIDELKRTRPEKFSVGYTPLCPECLRRLDEWDTFFGWYRWTCPDCSFKKSFRRSFSTEMKRATLLAREEIRKVRSGQESESLVLKKGYEAAFGPMKKA